MAKKYLSILIVSFFFVQCFAQNDSLHMTFKGIPIDGSLESFVQKLKKKGFRTNSSPNDLTGPFAGYSNCSVMVLCNEESQKVRGVGVLLPSTDSWDVLYSQYKNLKEMLTTKYGSPASSEEGFTDPDLATSDFSRMLQVKMGNCNFYSKFITDKAGIYLSIIQFQHLYSHVSLVYGDYLNNEESKENAIDDL